METPATPAEWLIQPIGVIRSPHGHKDQAPIQGALTPQAQGRVEVYSQFQEALRDIEMFSHLILIYLFDRAGEIKLVRPTFMDETPHGIFASRHPCRPNGLGLTVVRLLGREGGVLRVGGIDVLDGTPLIDIKPYMPQFDSFPQASKGWTEGKQAGAKPPGRE
ncbi:MAG: tRNA (N6-threonylcarbamoyladenosine(37)-N6)-methyltransferase TrmO [Pseudomonadota bacterium]